MLHMTRINHEPRATWELPKPRPLGGDAFFKNPDWRYEINAGGGEVREKRTPYRAKRKGRETVFCFKRLWDPLNVIK
jgi:hypothetical protein